MTTVKTTESRVTRKFGRFRSAFDYGPDCPTLTVYPPNVADSSQYEDLKTLVEKVLRGEVLPAGEPVYEVESGGDMEKAISEMPVTRQSGFDLSDASEALRKGREAALSLKPAEAVDNKPVDSDAKPVGSPPAPGASPGAHEAAK